MNRVIRNVRGSLLLGFALSSLPAFAKCPIPDGGTLIVRAAAGDLRLDNTGRDTVEVQVDNSAVQIQEICGKDVVEFRGTGADPSKGTTTWRIIAPRTVNLDLVTMAGSIVIPDVDRDVLLRTAGGSVTTGNIRGKAAIISQGGSIKAGNVGGNADFSS